jgi:two-component system, chemotaxis family, protein-glutamate methylesterase/glutaminase
LKAIKVLVVDDSSTMRMIITNLLSKEPDIEVVGTAEDAVAARQSIKALSPDVVTLDVEMPGMRGTEFLGHLMRLRPTPVVMVSTMTDQGSADAIHALELGAIDCVVKPSSSNPDSFSVLPAKIRQAHQVRGKLVARSERAGPCRSNIEYEPKNMVVAIGSSTGGVEALQAVIGVLPANCVPIVVTQHMPPNFTRSLAERINKSVAPTVVEAKHGTRLQRGHVYIAPGGDRHMEIVHGTCVLVPGDLVNGHRPSVDVLFASVARSIGDQALGVVLTGMGNDGAKGLLEMRQKGSKTLGQDEATSIVYGMPKAAFALGAVNKQLPLEKIGAEIVALTNMRGA